MSALASQTGSEKALTQDTPWQAIGSISADLPSWVRGNPAGRIASATAPAGGLSGEDLELTAFATFARALDALPGPPVRVWAFLPRVTEPDLDGLDRYMRMNIGRTRAYRREGRSLPFIPAGTCTGHAGHELVVHALWLPEACRTVENPRQRPAWAYTSRFGPSAPPFTRGVVVGGTLIAAGTAAVVGEETMHPGDLAAQWDESMANLEALRVAAGVGGAWRSMQVYVRDVGDLDAVRGRAARAFGANAARVVLAPLCRASLLVEIEGVCDG
jgi:chorismate lyase/3-hydroxybenzoate synthase